MNFIEIQNMSLSLRGNLVLDGIDLKAASPSFLSVIGPNGAGKSVFVKSLLGLLAPSKGSIRLFEREPKHVPASWIGYVPQFKNFERSFPARALDLVVSGLQHRWPSSISKKEKNLALESLRRVHAEHLIHRQVSTLSGGELQKCYLARALIQERKLIILDEPSTGIDTFGEADLYHIVENEQKLRGSNIIMVTHDLAVAQHHSSCVLLLNRKQISFGSPNDALDPESIDRAFGHSEHKHDGEDLHA